MLLTRHLQNTTVRRLCPAFFAKIVHRRRPPGASPGAPFAEIKLICIKLIPKTRGQPYCRKAFPSLKVRDGPPPESLAVSVPPVAPRRPEKSRTKYDFCSLTVRTKVVFCSVFFFWVGSGRLVPRSGPGAWRPSVRAAAAAPPGPWVCRSSGAAGPPPLALLLPSAPPRPPAPLPPPLGGAGGVRTGGGLAAASPCAAPSACRPWHRSPSRYCSHDSAHGGPSRCLHTSP